MPRPVGVPPPTPEWSEYDYLIENNFAELAERRIQLKYAIEDASKEIVEMDLQLGVMLATINAKSVRIGEHRITLGHSTIGGKLSRERLVELGVSKELLEAATSERKPGNNYIRITDVKGDD